MDKIDILLATYNGVRYLPEQIASIEAQTERRYRVLVRDDGSTDETPALLRAWRDRDPERVVILDTGTPSGGAAGNFARLMAASDADYMLFCDQDDIWAPEKLARTLAALRAAEAGIGRGKPVLAFCDLALVDADGNPIHPSFRRYQGLDVAGGTAFRRLLLENIVTGCAAGINAAARQLAGGVPAGAIMHDWWLALVCAGLGRVVAIPETLISYRQHGGNVVGARRWSLRGTLAGRRERDPWLARLVAQAAALQSCLGARLPAPQSAVLADLISLPDRGWLMRRVVMLRHGLRLSRMIRTLGLYLRV